MKITIKNIAPGPRGIHTTSGLALIEPGEEREVDLANGETIDGSEWFEKVAAKPASKATSDKA